MSDRLRANERYNPVPDDLWGLERRMIEATCRGDDELAAELARRISNARKVK